MLNTEGVGLGTDVDDFLTLILVVFVRRRVIFFFFFRIFGPKNKAPWPSSGLQKGRGKGGGG